jgi:hypothetical protein
MHREPIKTSLYTAAWLVSGLLGTSHADYIFAPTVLVTPESGQSRYTYTLTVDGASDFAGADWFLEVIAGAQLTDILAPSGWDVAYSLGDVGLYVSAPLDGSNDILPGESRQLSFLSPLLPASTPYTSFGINYSSADFEIVSGAIDGPALSVPEPSGFMLGGGALCALFGWLLIKLTRQGALVERKLPLFD